MDSELDRVIGVLIDYGYLRSREHIPPKKILKGGHGSCCYCGACGYMHDECVCAHNDLLGALRYKPLESVEYYPPGHNK